MREYVFKETVEFDEVVKLSCTHYWLRRLMKQRWMWWIATTSV